MSDKLDLNQTLNFQRKGSIIKRSFLVLNTTKEVDIFDQIAHKI